MKVAHHLKMFKAERDAVTDLCALKCVFLKNSKIHVAFFQAMARFVVSLLKNKEDLHLCFLFTFTTVIRVTNVVVLLFFLPHLSHQF